MGPNKQTPASPSSRPTPDRAGYMPSISLPVSNPTRPVTPSAADVSLVTQPATTSSNRRKIILIILGVIVILAVLGVGGFFLLRHLTQNNPVIAAQELRPSFTPYANYVLNGEPSADANYSEQLNDSTTWQLFQTINSTAQINIESFDVTAAVSSADKLAYLDQLTELYTTVYQAAAQIGFDKFSNLENAEQLFNRQKEALSAFTIYNSTDNITASIIQSIISNNAAAANDYLNQLSAFTDEYQDPVTQNFFTNLKQYYTNQITILDTLNQAGCLVSVNSSDTVQINSTCATRLATRNQAFTNLQNTNDIQYSNTKNLYDYIQLSYVEDFKELNAGIAQ